MAAMATTPVIKAGFLIKQGGNIKTWKSRWFVLQGNTLKYYKTQGSEHPLGVVPLKQVSVVRVVDEKTIGRLHGFTVPIVNGRKYVICANSEKERLNWMNAIDTAVQAAVSAEHDHLTFNDIDSDQELDSDKQDIGLNDSSQELSVPGPQLLLPNRSTSGSLMPPLSATSVIPASLAASFAIATPASISRSDSPISNIATQIKLASPIEVRIRVIAGLNLVAKDMSGTSDPFVVLKLGTSSAKTTTKEATLEPLWNERFKLINDISPQLPLIVEVWDEDRFSSPDFMGVAIIPLTQISAQPVLSWFTLGGLKTHLGLDKSISGEICLEISVHQDLSDWLLLGRTFHQSVHGLGYSYPIAMSTEHSEHAEDLANEFSDLPGNTESIEFHITNCTAVRGDQVSLGTFFLTPYRIVFFIDGFDKATATNTSKMHPNPEQFIIIPVATLTGVERTSERASGAQKSKVVTLTLKRSVFYPIRFGFKSEVGEALLNALEIRLLFHCSNSTRLPPALQLCREHIFPLAPPGTAKPSSMPASRSNTQSNTGTPPSNSSVFYTTVPGNTSTAPAVPQASVVLAGAVTTAIENDFEVVVSGVTLYDGANDKFKRPKLDAQTLGFRTAIVQADLTSEYLRFRLSPKKWRLASINENWAICESYPACIVTPASVPDEKLRKVATFRSQGRLPAIVWLHPTRGCVMVRAAQPRVGISGNFSKDDQNLLEAIRLASTNSSELVIFDARSRLAAEGNKLRGNGTEDLTTGYKNCRMVFFGIENIHEMRQSHDRLREVCESTLTSETIWLSQLQGTRWLEHIRLLLASAAQIAYTMSENGNSVLIHCSDGWDRTPQLTSLAQLMLDPHYRTIAGFRVLIEKEWLSFGHKFSDRLGDPLHPDQRSPIFLQFIDCVWQIIQQFPDAFEFTEAYLISLLDAINSRVFGTFLLNNEKERTAAKLDSLTFCLWAHLETRLEDGGYVNPRYRAVTNRTRREKGVSSFNLNPGSSGSLNVSYISNRKEEILLPVCSLKVIRLWSGWFLRGDQVFLPRFILSLPMPGEDGMASDSDSLYDGNGQNDGNLIMHQVLWLPNEAASRCFDCSIPFTILRRKHHCRACGKIFCGTCVSNRIPLPHLGYPLAQKVCNHCFSAYRPQYTSPSSSSNSFSKASVDEDD